MIFCIPQNGRPWKQEYGVIIATHRECLRTYDVDGSFFASACERNFIPVGIPVPVMVHRLAFTAWRERAYPEVADRYWVAARDELARAAVAMLVKEAA